MNIFPYDRSSELTIGNPLFVRDLEHFFWGAFESDTNSGDVTTASLPRTNELAEAQILAKSPGRMCGRPVVDWFLQKVNSDLVWDYHVDEAAPFRAGDLLMILKGPADVLLMLERTLLNTLQRLCSVATLTSRFVEKAPPCRVAGTRKTLYGLLDKYAVFVGGGLTHRLNLGDAPLYKDNHFVLTRGKFDPIAEAIKRHGSHYPFVTIEIKDGSNAEMGIRCLPRPLPCPLFLLFDNFPANQLQTLIPKLPARPGNLYYEASGGITFDNIRDYSKTGVDVLSVGALTHSAPAVDLKMRLIVH